MKNKKLFAVVLPVVAGAALAGTGFGAWVFSNNVQDANAGASINVTAAINVTGLKVDFSDNEITLDQGHDSDMQIQFSFDASAAMSKGIKDTVTNSLDGQYQAHTSSATSTGSANTVTYSSDEVVLDTTKIYKVEYSAHYNLNLSGAAADYLADPDGEVGVEIGETTHEYMTCQYDGTDLTILSAPGLRNLRTVDFDWKQVGADDKNSDANTFHCVNGTHGTHTTDTTTSKITTKPESIQEYENMVADFKNHEGKIVLDLTSFQVYGVECYVAPTLTLGETTPADLTNTYYVNGNPITLDSTTAYSLEPGDVVTMDSKNESTNGLGYIIELDDEEKKTINAGSEETGISLISSAEAGHAYKITFGSQA